MFEQRSPFNQWYSCQQSSFSKRRQPFSFQLYSFLDNICRSASINTSTPYPTPVTDRHQHALVPLLVRSGSGCRVSFRWPGNKATALTTATNTSPHIWPGLMQSSTECQRRPTWCLSTVRIQAQRKQINVIAIWWRVDSFLYFQLHSHMNLRWLIKRNILNVLPFNSTMYYR